MVYLVSWKNIYWQRRRQGQECHGHSNTPAVCKQHRYIRSFPLSPSMRYSARSFYGTMLGATHTWSWVRKKAVLRASLPLRVRECLFVYNVFCRTQKGPIKYSDANKLDCEVVIHRWRRSGGGGGRQGPQSREGGESNEEKRPRRKLGLWGGVGMFVSSPRYSALAAPLYRRSQAFADGRVSKTYIGGIRIEATHN